MNTERKISYGHLAIFNGAGEDEKNNPGRQKCLFVDFLGGVEGGYQVDGRPP